MPTTLQNFEAVGLLMIGLGLFLPIAGVVMTLGLFAGRLSQRLSSCEAEVLVLRERSHEQANQLSVHKYETAQNLRDALVEMRTELMTAIERLGERMDRAMKRTA